MGTQRNDGRQDNVDHAAVFILTLRDSGLSAILGNSPHPWHLVDPDREQTVCGRELPEGERYLWDDTPWSERCQMCSALIAGRVAEV